MTTYKLLIDPFTKEENAVLRSDGWSIPFDSANTDYQQFKKDISEGVEVQDAEGNVLDANEVKVLLRDLP